MPLPLLPLAPILVAEDLVAEESPLAPSRPRVFTLLLASLPLPVQPRLKELRPWMAPTLPPLPFHAPIPPGPLLTVPTSQLVCFFLLLQLLCVFMS